MAKIKMSEKQEREFSRIVDNCFFYLNEGDTIRFIWEAGALRGFCYGLDAANVKEDEYMTQTFFFLIEKQNEVLKELTKKM